MHEWAVAISLLATPQQPPRAYAPIRRLGSSIDCVGCSGEAVVPKHRFRPEGDRRQGLGLPMRPRTCERAIRASLVRQEDGPCCLDVTTQQGFASYPLYPHRLLCYAN